MLKYAFQDKRCTAVVVCTWLVLILLIFGGIGVFNASFFRVGPSASLHFMQVGIDTWPKWSVLAAFCLVDSLIKAFAHDSIVIWSIHTLCNPQSTAETAYPKWVCLAIIQTYYIYIYASGVFGLFIGLSQIDFVCINHASDLAMKLYTYNSYIDQKAADNTDSKC